MHRAAVAIMTLAVFAGCTAPDAMTDGATVETPTRSDPFTSVPPASTPSGGGSTTATPSNTVTPSSLPPDPPPTPPPTPPTPVGFTLTAWAVGDGTGKFVDASGAENPILQARPNMTITIDLLRNGQMHGLYVGSKTVIPAGTNDTRGSFEITDFVGDTEYGCPVHVTSMRGILRVVADGA